MLPSGAPVCSLHVPVLLACVAEENWCSRNTFIIGEGLLFPIPGQVLQTVVVDRILTALKELAPWWGSAGGQVVAIDTACLPYGQQFRAANRTGFRKNFPSTAGQSKLLFFFF